MKYTKLLAIVLFCCSLLVGCGKQNNISDGGAEPVTEKKENTTVVKKGTSVNSRLNDALNNSKPSYGSIESKEEDTSVGFFVKDETINVSGQYRGESYEVVLEGEKMEEFLQAIVQYTPTVHEKEYDYWPHTEEYPDMFILFEYNVLFDNGYQYRMDGGLCYPDGWDEFIEKIVAIMDL